jgi:hypothetical protein
MCSKTNGSIEILAAGLRSQHECPRRGTSKVPLTCARDRERPVQEDVLPVERSSSRSWKRCGVSGEPTGDVPARAVCVGTCQETAAGRLSGRQQPRGRGLRARSQTSDMPRCSRPSLRSFLQRLPRSVVSWAVSPPSSTSAGCGFRGRMIDLAANTLTRGTGGTEMSRLGSSRACWAPQRE